MFHKWLSHGKTLSMFKRNIRYSVKINWRNEKWNKGIYQFSREHEKENYKKKMKTIVKTFKYYL